MLQSCPTCALKLLFYGMYFEIYIGFIGKCYNNYIVKQNPSNIYMFL